MGEKNQCEGCKFWIQTGATDVGLLGECHRQPPSPVMTTSSADTKMYFALWPCTTQNQWCGDFEERPMTNEEVIKRMEMIKQLENDRKTKK